MQTDKSPEQNPAPQGTIQNAAKRFRSLRQSLLVLIALNVLLVFGLANPGSAHRVDAFTKALLWVPFNLVATVVYIVFIAGLSKADLNAAKAAGGGDAANTGSVFYIILCVALIIANWGLLMAA